MGKLISIAKHRKVLVWSLAYAAVVVWFLWVCSQFYIPGKGFTYLVMFGENQSADYLPELRATNYYQQEDSFGYDAQHYAQIAMRPSLDDPELKVAVDNLPYRARRILFSWSAYLLGGGDPVRALHVFAVQNIVCWVLLAAVLLHWFPPGSLGNFFRWAGVLLSFGLCFSVRGALVDGPSLLLIAIGIWLFERGRPGWSAVTLGIAGLGKETNILAAAAFVDPEARGWPAWRRIVLRGLIVGAPLFAWMLCLHLWLGSGGGAGSRNFALPFAEYWDKWVETLRDFGSAPDIVARGKLYMLIALTAQFAFLVVRPRWQHPWWRVGLAYSLLMIFLGEAVWEGYPGAASRVLLPMTLAFNVLVPRGRAWWVLLLLGNLTMLSTPDILTPPPRPGFTVSGDHGIRIESSTGRIVNVQFGPEWYPVESSPLEYWLWTSGDAELTMINPHAEAINATVSFELRTADDRTISISMSETPLWTGRVDRGETEALVFPSQRLEPGPNVWRFASNRPSLNPDPGDSRPVAFNIRNLHVRIDGWAPPVSESVAP